MTLRFKLILLGMAWLLRYARWRSQAFRERLRGKDLAVQIRTADGRAGRRIDFRDGTIRTRAGVHPGAGFTLVFKTAEAGVRFLMPPIDHLRQIEAMKNFLVRPEGRDEDSVWFVQTLMAAVGASWKIGTEAGDGTTRYVTMTNGGPLFIYVRDGKILRTTPIVFDEEDAPSWHCDDAPCIAAAPDAVRKREDGIVIIDPELARGRREIVDACPYGAVWWNEYKQVPQHWIFDAHLLDAGWSEPRCVTVCATGALRSVCLEDGEMQQSRHGRGARAAAPRARYPSAGALQEPVALHPLVRGRNGARRDRGRDRVHRRRHHRAGRGRGRGGPIRDRRLRGFQARPPRRRR